MNPRIFDQDGYRFGFFSNDHKPIHVHVVKGECEAVIEIEPVKVRRNIGFNDRELNKLIEIVNKRQAEIKEIWNEFFTD